MTPPNFVWENHHFVRGYEKNSNPQQVHMQTTLNGYDGVWGFKNSKLHRITKLMGPLVAILVKFSINKPDIWMAINGYAEVWVVKIQSCSESRNSWAPLMAILVKFSINNPDLWLALNGAMGYGWKTHSNTPSWLFSGPPLMVISVNWPLRQNIDFSWNTVSSDEYNLNPVKNGCWLVGDRSSAIP